MLKALVMLVLTSAVIIFAVQNSKIVEIQFLTWSFSTARGLLVVALLGIGFVLGLIAASLFSLKRKD